MNERACLLLYLVSAVSFKKKKRKKKVLLDHSLPVQKEGVANLPSQRRERARGKSIVLTVVFCRYMIKCSIFIFQVHR